MSFDDFATYGRMTAVDRLCISCDNAQYGCSSVLKLDTLPTHLEECEHNPKRPVPCEQGCGLVIPMDELKVRVTLTGPTRGVVSTSAEVRTEL